MLGIFTDYTRCTNKYKIRSPFRQQIRLSQMHLGDTCNRLGVVDEKSGGISGRRDAGRRNSVVPPTLLLVPLDVRHCDDNMSGRESGSELSQCHSRINRFFHGLLDCNHKHCVFQ